MSDNFNEDSLDGLDKKDLQKVQRLINKLLGKKDNTPKRSRKKTRSQKPKQKEQLKQNTQEQPNRVKRRKPRRKKREHESQKGINCRVSNIDTTSERPNLFFERGFDEECRADSKIDKKLAGNNVITPRAPTRLVTVECQECGLEYDVSPKLVLMDGSRVIFTCDNCQKSRK